MLPVIGLSLHLMLFVPAGGSAKLDRPRQDLNQSRFGRIIRTSNNISIGDEEINEVPVLERLGDLPSKRPAIEHAVSEPALAVIGKYKSVQVNVDAKGKNIKGDAANEPSFAVSPKNPNRLVAGWRQFDDVTNNFRQAGNAWTSDGGKTWHNQTVLTKGVFRSDPVLGFDALGNFYYNSLQLTFYTDVFKTLTGTPYSLIGPADGGDKQWMIVDATNSPGKGNLYQTWSTAGNNWGGRQFTRSTDGGKTWMDPINIPGSPVWGTLDVANNGDLYIGALGSQGFEFARSTNAKYKIETPTFDRVTNVDLGGGIVFGSAINPAGLMGQTWIVTDKSNGPHAGAIYMLCSVGIDNQNPCDVSFSRSTDGGQTWSPYVRVNDDPRNMGASHWFGAMAIAPNGRLDACWYDNRANPASNNSALYYSSSYDGGQSWTPSTQVSPSFNPNIGYPNQSKMGDYMGVLSDNSGTSVIYGATFNGEEDIWFLRIPIAAAQAVPAVGALTYVGTYGAGTVSSIQSKDSNTFDISSTKVNGLGDSAEIQASYVMPSSTPVQLAVQVNAKAVPKAAGGLWVYNWKAKSYIYLQAFTFDAGGNAAITMPIASINPAYFDPKGNLKVLIRAVLPQKYSTGKPFKFQTDLLQMLYG